MKQVSVSELQKKSGVYHDMALSEPITITKHDRPSLVLLSFEEYQRLTKQTRRSLSVSQLSEEDLAAIMVSEVPKEYEHLNEELEE
jgi:prevent-host-death family protein